MAMNLTDSESNMHSEEQKNPEQVAKFNITFRLYASTMKRKAYAILRDEGWAEDAVQWTFMKLLQHLNQIGDPYSVKARCYINTILVNNCFTLLKKNNRYYFMEDYTYQNDYRHSMIRADESLDNLIYRELLADVQQIPEMYSNLIILNGLYGYSPQQISELLDLKPATVRKRMQRGREMLQRQIEEKQKKNKKL